MTVDKFVVFNPLMWATRPDDKSLISRAPFDSSSYEHDEKLEPRRICSKEGPALFRIVILCFGEDDDDRTRVCASVFSSETWEWSLVSWRYVPKSSDSDDDDDYISLEDSMCKRMVPCIGYMMIGGTWFPFTPSPWSSPSLSCLRA